MQLQLVQAGQQQAQGFPMLGPDFADLVYWCFLAILLGRIVGFDLQSKALQGFKGCIAGEWFTIAIAVTFIRLVGPYCVAGDGF